MSEVIVLNLNKAIKRFDELEQGLRGPIVDEAMGVALTEQVDESQTRVPVWRSDLENSIEGVTNQRGDTVEGVYSVGEEYGVYQEFGSKPHFVPAKYIGEWAQDHGFGYTGLQVTGRAQPFVRRNQNEILRQVGERMANRTVDLATAGVREALR